MKRKKTSAIFGAALMIIVMLGCWRCSIQAHAQIANVIPTNVSTTALSASAISISWTAPVANTSTFLGYYVYRNGNQIAQTNITSYVDSGLVPGLYTYSIAMFDTNGTVFPRSAPVTLSLVSDTTPPSVPKNVVVSANVSSTNNLTQPITISISWDASTDNVAVAGYNVFRNGASIVTSTPYTSTSIIDTVTPGTYTYRITAYDAADNVSPASAPVSVFIPVDNVPPSVPTHLIVQQNSATSMLLTWASSTDNVGVAGYQVFRDGVPIATTTGSSFNDTGLSTNESFTYFVTAFDAAGNISNQSLPVNATLQLYSGPTPPIIWSLVPVGTSSISLSWFAGGDAVPVIGYAIYRNGTQIASQSSTNYIDTGLAPGLYAYSLSETDSSGASSQVSSSTNVVVPKVIVTVPATPSTTPNLSIGTMGMVTSAGTGSIFTQFLYLGLRGQQVGALQSFLIKEGDLSSSNATGYFGTLTLRAVEKFQCAENIVCTGGVGWGGVGPKTRNVLNKMASLP